MQQEERKRKKCVFTYPEDTIEKRACKEKKKLNNYKQKTRQREEGIGEHYLQGKKATNQEPKKATDRENDKQREIERKRETCRQTEKRVKRHIQTDRLTDRLTPGEKREKRKQR